MSFGLELKEFVEGFQAGHKMWKSKEEKEWEREEREMKRDTHKWGRENTLYDRKYREDRAARSDYQFDVGADQFERKFVFDQQTQEWRVRDAAEQRAFDREKYNRDVETDERDFYEKRRLEGQTPLTEDERLPGDLETYFPNDEVGIPDDVMGSATGMYAPDGTSIAPASMAGGRARGGGRDPYAPAASLIHNESGGNWRAQNSAVGAGGKRGHFGRVQFGHARLSEAKAAGAIPRDMTPQQFMNSPEAQMRAERWHFADIDRQAERRGLTQYIGRVVGGVPVTPDAIRAMAHLGGIGGAEKFLKSGGRHNPADANGTSLRDYGIRHGGVANRQRKRAVTAARGGMIARPAVPMPDDEEEDYILPASGLLAGPEDEVAATPVSQEVEPAIPDEAPTPTPRPDDTSQGNSRQTLSQISDDVYEQSRIAVREGIEQAMARGQATAETGIADPEIQARQDRMARGYGAATPQLIRQAQDLIDPDREMTRSERNFKSFGVVHRFFLDRGEYDKAKDVAESMFQALNRESQQFIAMAQVAAENGDHSAAAKAAMAAHANIPNGENMTIEEQDGRYVVRVTSEETGEELEHHLITPEEMAAMAMGFSPATVYEQIMLAAGREAPERENASLSDVRATEEGIEAYEDEFFGELDYSPAQTRAIRAVASNIGSDIANQMGPREALEFAEGLAHFDKDDLKNENAPFSYEPVRGGKEIEVTDKRSGKTVKMTTSQFNNLTSMRADVAAGRQKKAATQEQNAQWWSDRLSQGMDAGRKFFNSPLFLPNLPGMAIEGVRGVIGEEADRPAGRGTIRESVGNTVRGVTGAVTDVITSDEGQDIPGRDALLDERAHIENQLLTGQMRPEDRAAAQARVQEIDRMLGRATPALP